MTPIDQVHDFLLVIHSNFGDNIVLFRVNGNMGQKRKFFLCT